MSTLVSSTSSTISIPILPYASIYRKWYFNFFILLLLLHLFIVGMCMSAYAMAHVCGSEDSLWEAILFPSCKSQG